MPRKAPTLAPTLSISLMDRRVLGLLPLDGDAVGHHKLRKPVRAIVEDLNYEFTPDQISGSLRGLEYHGFTKMTTEDDNRNRNGWVATEAGREAIAAWDSLLYSHALMRAVREGDGLAEIVATEDGGPVVGYVVSPARYARMADDPAGGRVTVGPKGMSK